MYTCWSPAKGLILTCGSCKDSTTCIFGTAENRWIQFGPLHWYSQAVVQWHISLDFNDKSRQITLIVMPWTQYSSKTRWTRVQQFKPIKRIAWFQSSSYRTMPALWQRTLGSQAAVFSTRYRSNPQKNRSTQAPVHWNTGQKGKPSLKLLLKSVSTKHDPADSMRGQMIWTCRMLKCHLVIKSMSPPSQKQVSTLMYKRIDGKPAQS